MTTFIQMDRFQMADDESSKGDFKAGCVSCVSLPVMPGASRPQHTDIDCCANQRCTAILLVLHT